MQKDQPVELVTVVATTDPGEFALAQPLLQGAGIEYVTRNDQLAGAAGFATVGYLGVIDAVKILVRPEDAEQARAVLGDLAARP